MRFIHGAIAGILWCVLLCVIREIGLSVPDRLFSLIVGVAIFATIVSED